MESKWLLPFWYLVTCIPRFSTKFQSIRCASIRRLVERNAFGKMLLASRISFRSTRRSRKLWIVSKNSLRGKFGRGLPHPFAKKLVPLYHHLFAALHLSHRTCQSHRHPPLVRPVRLNKRRHPRLNEVRNKCQQSPLTQPTRRPVNTIGYVFCGIQTTRIHVSRVGNST